MSDVVIKAESLGKMYTIGHQAERGDYLSTNAHGTLNLLELMRKFDITKMVLASSSSLYAGQKMPFTEDLPVNTPVSPYAVTKKAAEMLAHSMG